MSTLGLEQDNHTFIKVVYNDNVSISNYSTSKSNIGDNIPNNSYDLYNWVVYFPFSDQSVKKAESELKISVYRSELGRDSKVGKFSLTHDEIMKAEGESNAIDRTQSFDSTVFAFGSKYDLHFKTWWEKVPENYIFPIPNLLLLTNKSMTGGVQHFLLAGEKFKRFKNWQIRLWNVGPSFDDEKCGWNREYSAAQKIYGRKIISKPIRATLKLQHAALYRKDKTGPFVDVDNIKTSIHGLGDLLNSLPQVNKKNNKSLRFTYVITNESFMNFSVTSKQTAQDFLSKHALHNGAKPELFYAGEFFVDRRSSRYLSTNKPALVIDNNSGTFAPPAHKLEKLEKLLKFNFGDEFPIFVLDREDPVLKELFEVNDVE